jgi:hypothetical protein
VFRRASMVDLRSWFVGLTIFGTVKGTLAWRL